MKLFILLAVILILFLGCLVLLGIEAWVNRKIYNNLKQAYREDGSPYGDTREGLWQWVEEVRMPQGGRERL